MSERSAAPRGCGSPGARPRAVEVWTPARLHLGMLSFGVPTVRSFGGVGVMIDRPRVHLRLEPAAAFRARGPMHERVVECAARCGRAWGLDGTRACAIDVLAAPPPHVGLGSGTQLALAVAAGMRRLLVADDTPVTAAPATDAASSVGADEAVALARAAGRGLRSFVGVHGFASGGLIVEAGRITAAAGGPTASPLVARVVLPARWRCLLVVQRDEVGLHGDPERAAFARLEPVPAEITAELARIALMELVPAAVEGDFATFSDAVHRYGRLAGRPFEPESSRLAHAGATARLVAWLGEQGVRGRAQSSWGPAVMGCCESAAAAEAVVERFERSGLSRTHAITVAEFDARGAFLRDAG